MRTVRCPQCGEEIVWSEAEFRPFCSERCRTIDLGEWLGERYVVPGEPANVPDEEDESS